jgi:drug/metabolite transporter (DMT)-like permease
MGATALLMGAFALVTERGRTVHFNAASVAALLYLALAGSALTFTLYFWLLKRLPATSLALINYGTPVVAVAVGAAWFGEPVTRRTLAGSALIVAGVALALRSRRAPAPAAPEAVADEAG